MADGNVEIKMEPLDDEEPTAMQFEELIIKHELDNNPETEREKTHELITPKEEPLDEEEYLTLLEKSLQETAPPSDSPKPAVERCKRDTGARAPAIHKRLRCREPNVCNICGQIFRTRIILEDHLQQHRDKVIKSTKTSPHYRRILPKPPPKSPPEPPKYNCKTCQLTFTNSQSFANHNRIHEGSKHICNKCGKSFKYLAELKKHNSGDTCVTEAVEEVLKNAVKIKEEVESENEETTERIHTSAEEVYPKQAALSPPPVVIKKEPPEEPVTVKEEPEDSLDYEELILKELIERKAKSIAKAKASQGQTQPNQRQFEKDFKLVSVDKTDFEQVIHSTKLILSPSKDSPSRGATSTDDDSTQHSIPTRVEPQNHSIPKPPNKSVIKSLKEEYQKAKKKKLDESLTDDSSQNSSQSPSNELPSSVYFPVTGDTEPYNQAVRTLKRTHMNFRYNWVCPSCPRRYIQRHGFVKHLLSSHHNTMPELEGKLFELKPELCSLNIGQEDSYCTVCRVTLADAASLKKHRNEFHKEDTTTVHMPYRCDKCGKFCSTRSTLGDHVLANCGTEPQYGCSECGKKFYTKSTLNLHKTMHTGELPHKCTFCEKRFRTRGQLTVHTRTHTGERPFPCKVCDKRFTHRETLIAHLSRHIDMKRYKCYGCQTFFSCISGLKTHRLTRMSTCGQFKLNARPVGPRVRVIKGNVIFEPQPKINPYFRRHDEESDEKKKNVLLQQNGQNVQEIEKLFKKDSISVDS